MKRRRSPVRQDGSRPGVVLGPHGPYIPARTSTVVEHVAEREFYPNGTVRRERVGRRATEVRDLGGLAAEMPPPLWYRAWLRFWGVVVVAAAWLVWAVVIVFAAGVLTVGAIHLWGPPGVWLAIAAMIAIWWGRLVRRAWREQGGRDR